MSNDHLPNEELSVFFEEGFITDVLFPVKSGKEATVYCCRAHPRHGSQLLAAKVYKPIAFRSFRDDAIYQEGRFGRETRETRAMRNKSVKGRAFQYATWLEYEFAMLKTLHAAGADVPRPIKVGGSAILMEFIGDGEVAAPPLHTIRLAVDEAEELLDRALRNVEIMLSRNIVHGDLSPYNVLYANGRLVIIDLPQAVDARVNSNARRLLARDVGNLCRYFARFGAATEPDRYVDQLWDCFERATL